MPRINFIPPPISFQDRGEALVSPIMSNAMQLMETFSTDIPRIRMQREAVAEDKRRYEGGVEREASRYSDAKSRQSDLDFLNQHAGWEMLMRPDALDLDGDGQPDITGNVSSRGGVTLPKMGTAKGAKATKAPNYSTLAQNYAKNMVAKKLLRNAPLIDPATRKQAVDSAGLPVFKDQDESDEAQKARLKDAMFSLFKTGDAASRAKARAIYDQGYDPLDVDIAGSTDGTAWQAIRDWAHTEEDAEASAEATATVGSGGTPTDSRAVAGGATSGTPIHSAMGRMLALQKLDSLAASPQTTRVRLGLPNDMQIKQLKMQIMQSAQPQQPAAPEETLPADQMQAALQPDTHGEQPAAPGEQPAAPVDDSALQRAIAGLPDPDSLKMGGGVRTAKDGLGGPVMPGMSMQRGTPIIGGALRGRVLVNAQSGGQDWGVKGAPTNLHVSPEDAMLMRDNATTEYRGRGNVGVSRDFANAPIVKEVQALSAQGNPLSDWANNTPLAGSQGSIAKALAAAYTKARDEVNAALVAVNNGDRRAADRANAAKLRMRKIVESLMELNETNPSAPQAPPLPAPMTGEVFG